MGSGASSVYIWLQETFDWVKSTVLINCGNITMRQSLAIILNGDFQFEYDREDKLGQAQVDYLNSMDEGMDSSGVIINKVKIQTPNQEQKYDFVAANLYNAMKADNEGMIGPMITYLAMRSPDLKEVQFSDENEDDEVSIEMVYDEACAPGD